MTRANPWLKVGFDAWSLGLEMSAVMGLRALRIAGGGPEGAAEAGRMVSEKLDAGLALQAKALTGGLGMTPHEALAGSVAHYRRVVRANRRRLART